MRPSLGDLQTAHRRWPRPLRYALALALVAVAALLRYALLPVGAGFAFLSFYPAVALAFFLGGAGPGWLAVTLGVAVADLLFVPQPAGRTTILMPTGVFLIGSWLISRFAVALHAASTRLRETLASLRAAEQRYLAILADQTDILWRFDAGGRIGYVNEACCRAFGRPAAELLGRPWQQLLAPQDLASTEAALRQLTLEHPVATLESRIGGNDALRCFQFVHRASFDAAGRLGEIQSVGRDISELKHAESQRLRAVELEAENRQLRDASRLKSRFLANMSHELRTPLNAVLGFAQLMRLRQEAPGSPQYDTFLGHIVDSGRQLLRMIEALLEASSVASERLAFAPAPVHLAALLQEAQDVLRGEIQSKRLRIIASCDPAIAVVCVDPLRLRQVLTNLLSNAIGCSALGGHVRLRALAEGPVYFRIEVEDDGIGIAADIPRLFQDFERLADAPVTPNHGPGLGLALARRLVEGQGGSIGVRSTPGVGSVFHLTLPRAPEGGAAA